MKNNKIYDKWHIKNSRLPNEIYINEIKLQGKKLEIKVQGSDEDNDPIFSISFSDFIGFRIFDESNRLQSLNLYPYNSKEWCLFKSHNSEFLDWLVEESLTIENTEGLIHYSIATSDDIIDIICEIDQEPIIEEL